MMIKFSSALVLALGALPQAKPEDVSRRLRSVPIPPPPPHLSISRCEEGYSLFQLDLTPDAYPGETTWTLTNTCTDEELDAGGPYWKKDANMTLTVTQCVKDSQGLSFTIKDSYGDGICCNFVNGGYTLTYDGIEVPTETGGAFTYEETTEVAPCWTGTPTGAPSIATTGSRTAGSTGAPTAADSTGMPTSADSMSSSTGSPTGAPSIADTVASSTGAPTIAGTAASSTGAPTIAGTSTTGAPTAADSTGMPTGMPTVAGSTGAPTAADSTGMPTVAGSTGAPTAADSTGMPTAADTVLATTTLVKPEKPGLCPVGYEIVETCVLSPTGAPSMEASTDMPTIASSTGSPTSVRLTATATGSPTAADTVASSTSSPTPAETVSASTLSPTSADTVASSTSSPTQVETAEASTGSPTAITAGGLGGPASVCAEGESFLEITINLDEWPTETYWYAYSYDCSSSYYYGCRYRSYIRSPRYWKNEAGMEYTYSACVPHGKTYFYIYDSYGDGMCCEHGEGGYTLSLDGEVVKTGGDFGRSERNMLFPGSEWSEEVTPLAPEGDEFLPPDVVTVDDTLNYTK